jgi:hypothetical protein
MIPPATWHQQHPPAALSAAYVQVQVQVGGPGTAANRQFNTTSTNIDNHKPEERSAAGPERSIAQGLTRVSDVSLIVTLKLVAGLISGICTYTASAVACAGRRGLVSATCCELLRRVEGERRVVAPLGLGPEPLGRARARMLEGLCGDHCEPAGPPDGDPEQASLCRALLVLSETREAAAPDRPRVLLRGADVEKQLAAGLQHPGDGGQEAAEVEVVNAVECGDHIEAGGPQRQLFGS